MSRPLPNSTTATSAERLLVTGSREWTDGLTIEAELARVRPALVIEGGARGADRLAAAAARRLGIEVLEVPADWQREGRRAGVLRNVQMLREGRPTQVLAFHDDLAASRGTAHMCRIAHQAGLLVTLISHREDSAPGYLRRAPEAVLLLASLFHPWPADKRGGSDPDRCPECGQTTYRRALRWDGAAWRRPQPTLLTCSRCGHAWVPPLIDEPDRTAPVPDPAARAGHAPAAADLPGLEGSATRR